MYIYREYYTKFENNKNEGIKISVENLFLCKHFHSVIQQPCGYHPQACVLPPT